MVIARASTCASGRNTSSRSPLSSSVGKHALAPRISYTQVGVGQLAALGPARWCPRCRSAWPGRSALMPRHAARQLGRDRPTRRPRPARPAPWGPSRRCCSTLRRSGSSPASSVSIGRVRVGLGERPAPRPSRCSTQRTCSAEDGLVDRHGQRAHRTGWRSRGSATRSGSPTASRPGRRAARPSAIKPSAAERIWRGSLGAGDICPAAVDQALEDDVVGVVAFVFEHRLRRCCRARRR